MSKENKNIGSILRKFKIPGIPVSHFQIPKGNLCWELGNSIETYKIRLQPRVEREGTGFNHSNKT